MYAPVTRAAHRVGSRRLPVLLTLVCMAALFGAAAGTASAASYIVVLKSGTNPAAAAAKYGVVPTATYTSALTGYAADLSASQLSKVKNDASTSYVDTDQAVSTGYNPVSAAVPQPAQVPQIEIMRVGGLQSSTAKIDGTDERVNVDIAVLDTGIDSTHPDLNVVGGVNCSSGKGYEDVDSAYGHGTFVGGLAAAIDNSIGIVGVAPGARLWSVRVLNKMGSGPSSQIMCGIDWVTKHADVIDVANMSLAGPLKELDSCGTKKAKAFHQAVCSSVAAGVTYVVGAGNDSADAITAFPAAYPEVITASAMADSDGVPGGLGGPPRCVDEQDDTFAFFSNFGASVDLSAPGVCDASTFPGGLYARGSGTSFASPIVAGAAGLYIANHPGASPASVRAALIAAREQVAFPDDPDGIAEGVVNVAGF